MRDHDFDHEVDPYVDPHFDREVDHEFDHYDGEEDRFEQYRSTIAAPRAEAPPSAPPLARKVKAALVRLLAACHLQRPDQVAALVSLARSGESALAVLSVADRATVDGALEVVDYEAATAATVVDLSQVPAAVVYTDAVRQLLTTAAAAHDPDASNPSADWLAVLEEVKRFEAVQAAQDLITVVHEHGTVAQVLDAHTRVTRTVPTARKSPDAQRSGARTAREVVEQARVAAASTPPRRFSSGYRTLDIWVTNSASGEPMGFIAPGEGVVVAAGTGQGKSSFSYRLVPALAQDLVNWGLGDAKVYFAHTEEAPETKARAMALEPGQRFHHLADTIVINEVGSSREAFVCGLYDLVVDAYQASQATGRSIVDFLPHIVVLDYLQSLSGEKENDVVTATFRTAELILRGIQAWNPSEMAKWGGVEFATYTGMAWPSGMENHRVATVAFAQLVKAAGNTGPYRPGAKGVQISDYVVLDANGNPCWELKEGDQPVLGKKEIFGSSTILNNATFIVFLHRSNIHAGKTRGTDGKVHLSDTRARLVIDKMRNGALSPVVPMAFDSQPDGFRGQYYDPLAEQAMGEGYLNQPEGWMESGDPILPARPSRRPLTAWSY